MQNADSKLADDLRVHRSEEFADISNVSFIVRIPISSVTDNITV